MRKFELHRTSDVSGVSGTGVVAEGIEFSDGTVAIRWLSEHASTVMWASLADAMAVHGHDGATTAVFEFSGTMPPMPTAQPKLPYSIIATGVR